MKEFGKILNQPFRRFTDNIRSFWLYDTDQKMLDYARDKLIRNWRWVQMCIDNGNFTQGRLDEIRADTAIQDQFHQILHDARSFSKRKFQDAEHRLETLPPDQIAAFYLYQIDYFEQRYHIKLISREEDFI
jgi:hypothetical protein